MSAGGARARGGALRRLLRRLRRLLVGAVVASIVAVGVLRFVDPPVTPLMLLRLAQGALHGSWVGIDQRWVALDDVSPALLRSVIAAEDARFFQHHGVDLTEVERARAYNERQRGRRLHGASTISMQCARSTFLWTGRTYLRKALELYFTGLIELLWGKRRILEVYLNVVEWGDGVYGVDAAARRSFAVSAAHLSPGQAALLAAVLPSPRRWSAAVPSRYVRARAARIARWAREVDLGPVS